VAQPLHKLLDLRQLEKRAAVNSSAAVIPAHTHSSSAALVCGDPFTAQLLALAERVARTEVTVLIGGASGTGKEMLARHLHARSLRATGPFVAFNCACLPEAMVEDMLFGHEKGSFTGAIQKFDGYFGQAHGGTLFLDEVGELPMPVQAKLLRVLQEREYTPLGSTTARKTEFRLLAATNRDIKADIKAGRFREDLFYRLSIFPLTLKPLAERRGDIWPLVCSMLEKYRDIGSISGIDPDAAEALLTYDWPGNVRELENVIQRALIVADGQCLNLGHLGLDFFATRQDRSAVEIAEPDEQILVGCAAELHEQQPSEERLIVLEPAAARPYTLAIRRDSAEAEVILTMLKESPTKAAAAAKLGISERTLRYKLARYRESGLLAANS
jgi:two-component system response regulator FlrC